MTERLREEVFKAKVIQTLKQLRGVSTDSDSEEASPEGRPKDPEQLAHEVRQDKISSGNEASLFSQHERFLKKQVQLAEQYLEKKRRLPVVSSKLPVEGEECPYKKPALDGKGPRTVSASEKNRRQKLKKKRAKERSSAALHQKDTTDSAL